MITYSSFDFGHQQAVMLTIGNRRLACRYIGKKRQIKHEAKAKKYLKESFTKRRIKRIKRHTIKDSSSTKFLLIR